MALDAIKYIKVNAESQKNQPEQCPKCVDPIYPYLRSLPQTSSPL